MLKLQRFLLSVAALLCLLVALVLVIQNLAVMTPFQFAVITGQSAPLGALMAIVGVLVAGGILLKMWGHHLSLRHQQRQTHRELEKKEVSREEAAAQVRVLESKVQTLERALQEALKSREPQ